jgi:adenylate cyclase
VAREQRKLAAIVSADVAGYSRLMGRDESGTLAALKALRRAVVDPKISENGGRIVKTTGDGLLLEFASVVDAVRCVVGIQTAMAAHNADMHGEHRITFRIGVNIGDIIIDGDDIFGDGVNVAARLQELADPGGVCVSDFVQQQVRGKLEVGLTDIGEQQFKNIAHPVRAWRVQGLGTPTAAATAPSAANERASRPGLAVLAFDNLSGEAALEAFCDGLSEDLITTLSRFRWVQVVSRKSSFAYKGRSPDIRQVARELGVAYVLEGSVRLAGHRVRINAQLVSGHSGQHAWAQRYDRDFGDPFDLQDEIVRSIAGSLDYVLWYGLVRGEGAPDSATSPLRAAAWHLTQLTAADDRLAIACARRALERNPRSVAACQYEAVGYMQDLLCGWSGDVTADIAAAVEAGRRAVALSPADAASQGIFGLALALARDPGGALASGRRALSLGGTSTNALGFVIGILSLVGEAAESNDLIARMLDLAPAHHCRAMYVAHMALNWLRLGAPERGLPYADEAVRLKPEAIRGHLARAAVLAAIGRTDEARAALAPAFALRPDLDAALVDAMTPYSDPADAERLHQALCAAGLRDSKT